MQCFIDYFFAILLLLAIWWFLWMLTVMKGAGKRVRNNGYCRHKLQARFQQQMLKGSSHLLEKISHVVQNQRNRGYKPVAEQIQNLWLFRQVVYTSSVPTRFLPLTVSVIVRVRGKLVRLELEVNCQSQRQLVRIAICQCQRWDFVSVRDKFVQQL